MVDVERWIDTHEAELLGLAEQFGTRVDTVEFLATLVLRGFDDDEIYEELREVTPSWDGQHSPLAGAADLVRELRSLADAS